MIINDKSASLITANPPNSDYTICVPTKQCASICTPAQACAVYDLQILIQNNQFTIFEKE